MIAFTTAELLCIFSIFIWTGFVRTGLGFGGAVLGLPLLLLLVGQSPIYWLPIIGCHLLIFTLLTLLKSPGKIDWQYLRRSFVWIIPAALVGIFGLIKLSTNFMTLFVYGLTCVYAVSWIFNRTLNTQKPWMDASLLVLGGYVGGLSHRRTFNCCGIYAACSKGAPAQ